MQNSPELDQLSGIMAMMGVIVVGGLFFYVYLSIVLMILARKTNTPNGWLAWIPIGNMFLMCQIARKPGWYVILLLIPLVNIIVGIMVWMAIAEVRGKASWTGLLIIIPIVNLVVMAYLAAGPSGQIGTAQFSSAHTTSATGARICPHCQAMVDPGDLFCGVCGRQVPVPKPSQPQAVPAKSSGGKAGLVAIAVVAVLVVALGGIGFFVYRRWSYSPPNRQQPNLPQRAAGTLTEFPVDTNANAPARPSSVITQNFPQAGAANSSQKVNVPEKWLPPGVDPKSLPQRAEAITSATYRTPSVTNTRSNQSQNRTATTADQVYVHVLNSPANRSQEGRQIANAVSQSTRGERTGIRVTSPDGDVYTGSRIKTPQVSVSVLDKENSNVVIIIYSPNPATNEVAERLTQNVGNGEGLNDYPEVQGSIWTLPSTPPNGFSLQEVNTLTSDDMQAWMSQAEQAGGNNNAEIQRLLSQIRQFIPERLTNARYQDQARKDWHVVVGDYGSTRSAWMTWSFLRWTAGIAAMQSVTVSDSDGLFANNRDQSLLIFQKGPYLIMVSGPSGATVQSLTELASRFQV